MERGGLYTWHRFVSGMAEYHLHHLQWLMAVLPSLQECNICTHLTLCAPLCKTAFHADRSDAFTHCCHLTSAVLTSTASLCVTGRGHHFDRAKSKLTTQTSHNATQLILKVFHLQRKKKCVLDSQFLLWSEGCHAAGAAEWSLVLETLTGLKGPCNCRAMALCRAAAVAQWGGHLHSSSHYWLLAKRGSWDEFTEPIPESWF